MNILYLSEPDPRMTHFGGAQRTNFIWRALQEVGNVYTLTFDQRFQTEEVAPRLWYVKKLQKVNFIRDFLYKVQLRFFLPLHVLHCWPVSTKIEKTIEEIFPGIKFDVVVCRYLDVLGEMHFWGHPHLIVDIDDDPREMFETVRVGNVPKCLRPVARWILNQQLSFLLSKISAGWVSNIVQIERLSRTKTPIVSLPNIALKPSVHYNPKSQRKQMIISVGAMDYKPNYLGVDRFLTEIWPSVHDKFPSLTYAIIGKNAPLEYQDKWKKIPNVVQMGFVEDLERLYEQCLCSVVSVYEGGGTCIKTLESLSYSRVCLATPFGARGHELAMERKQIGLFRYSNVSEFLVLFEQEVIQDIEREKNERLGSQYIEENYSYDSFVSVVRETLETYANS